MKHSFKYKIMFMSAMAVFGTIGLFVKSVSVSSGELALYRAMLAMVLIGGFMLATRQRIVFREIKRQIPLFLFLL